MENILQFLQQENIILYADVVNEMNKKTREKLLKKHPYNIWQGKDGYWYTYLPDRKKGRVQRRRSSREELMDVIVEYYWRLEKKPTVPELFEEWNELRIRFGEIKRNSYTKYKNDFSRFFQPDDKLCKVPVPDITEADITEFIKVNIRRYSLNRKAYNSLRTLISGIFKYAKSRRLTEISISGYFGDLQLSRSIFTRTRKSPEEHVFNEDEQEKLTAYLEEHPTVHNLGLLLLFMSGLRIGELCVLEYSDIGERGIHVSKTEEYYIDEKGKRVYEISDTPKCGADERDVIIPDKAREVVRQIRHLNPFGQYLFMKNGKRINSTRFNYFLYKACDAVGIPRRSTHCIRKTYISRLYMNGVDEATIQKQAGHTDSSTTRSYYRFVVQNQQHQQEAISRAIGF